jgi:hypothetical protein
LRLCVFALKLKVYLRINIGKWYSARNKHITGINNHLGAAAKVIFFGGIEVFPLLKKGGDPPLKVIILSATGAALNITTTKLFG